MKCNSHIISLILLSGSLVFAESCQLFKKTKKPDSDGTVISAESDFDAYFIDACTHLNNGNFATAIKLLNKCSEIKPEEASVYYQLSKAYAGSGDKISASQNAMKAYKQASSNVYYALWYADRLKLEGNTTDAIVVLEKSFENNPKDVELVKALDALYVRSGDPLPKRIAIWQKYRAASGYKLNTALTLIELYKAKKDYASAHSVYDEIKKASPAKYKYFIDDANLYLEQNDESNASLNFEKALEINPNNFQLNYSLFKLHYKKHNKASASKHLQQAFSDPFQNAESKLTICAELNQEMKTDSNYREYTLIVANEMLRLYPDNPNVQFTAARFYEENKRYSEALLAFKKVTLQKPGMYDAWIGAMKNCDKLGLYREKLDIANQAIEYYPNIATIYLEAALALFELNEAEQSLKYCQSGLSFAFDKTIEYQLHVQSGLAHFKLGNYKASELSLQSALAINSGDKQLYDYIGNVYAKLLQKEKALEYWKKAKELGLNHPTLEKKIMEGKYVE